MSEQQPHPQEDQDFEPFKDVEKEYVPAPEPEKNGPEVEPAKEKQPELSAEEKKLLSDSLLQNFGDFVGQVQYLEGNKMILVNNEGDRARLAYEAAAGRYKSLIGKDFNNEVKAKGAAAAEAQGKKIITKEEYFSPERQAATRKDAQRNQWAEGIKAAWKSLGEEEKKAEGNIDKFGFKLEAARRTLKEEGVELSADQYYRLFKEGYDPRTISRKRFFGRKTEDGRLFGAGVEMENLKGEKIAFKLEDFKSQMNALQSEVNQDLDRETAERMREGYKWGKSRWLKRKLSAAGNLIEDATSEYKETASTDGAQATKPEIISVEQQEAEAKKEYDAKVSAFSEAVAKVRTEFGLTDGDALALGAYVLKPEGKPAFLPKISKTILRALIEKRQQIEKIKKEKLDLLDRQKTIKARFKLLSDIKNLAA